MLGVFNFSIINTFHYVENMSMMNPFHYVENMSMMNPFHYVENIHLALNEYLSLCWEYSTCPQ